MSSNRLVFGRHAEHLHNGESGNVAHSLHPRDSHWRGVIAIVSWNERERFQENQDHAKWESKDDWTLSAARFQDHSRKPPHRLNHGRFPVIRWRKTRFPCAKRREKDFPHICPRQLNFRTQTNRNAIFCFHEFFPIQSVMIAFIKMKKCKIKSHWAVQIASSARNHKKVTKILLQLG